MDGFSTFVGTLKQIVPEDLGDDEAPTKIRAFQWAFPAFLDPLQEHITDQSSSSAKARRRRYSGGAFSGVQPLPRGRYSSICQSLQGDDRGTLCRELSAYAGSVIRQRVDIHDALLDKTAADRGSLYLWFDDPDGQIAGRMFSGGIDAGMFFNDLRPGWFGIRLPYRLQQVTIENVVDLRSPATQQWFFETFRFGFGEFWKKPSGANAQRFTDMLPTLYDTSLGGNEVTDAIGYCLRRMGAAALIYPSARCNAAAIAENGVLSRWSGFNLVDFREEGSQASPTALNAFHDASEWTQQFPWPRAKLVIIDPADRNAELLKQSWAVGDIQQSHDEFYANGGMLGGREVGEWIEAGVDKKGAEIRAMVQATKAAVNDKPRPESSADQAIAFATKFDDADALLQGVAYYNLYKDVRARGHSQQSEELWRKSLHTLLLASRSKITIVAQAAKLKIGWMYHVLVVEYLRKGDTKNALRHSDAGVKMLEEAAKGPRQEAVDLARFELGKFLNNLGCAYLNKRDRNRAHKYFVRAIAVDRTLIGVNPLASVELAIALGNDSNCRRLRGDNDGALSCAEEATKLAANLVQADGSVSDAPEADCAFFGARGALIRALTARRRLSEAETNFGVGLDVLLATMARDPDCEARWSRWPMEVFADVKAMRGEKSARPLMFLTLERYAAAGREYRIAIN